VLQNRVFVVTGDMPSNVRHEKGVGISLIQATDVGKGTSEVCMGGHVPDMAGVRARPALGRNAPAAKGMAMAL
jgi:hypothetical protein